MNLRIRVKLWRRRKKSLIRKNYVFKDFGGGLIFNKELVKYFEPVVLCRGYAACSIRGDGYIRNLGYYIKKDDFVCMDKEPLNKENFVLTYKKNLSNLYDSIFRKIDVFDTEEEESFLSFAFIMTESPEKPRYLSYRLYKGGVFEISEKGELKEVGRQALEKAVGCEIKYLAESVEKSDERNT
ncbi:MAG: hypothetical protein LUG24_07895 [Clostridiales bacterium]|nr:hypothetical protein [Clostridiales bacterium]